MCNQNNIFYQDRENLFFSQGCVYNTVGLQSLQPLNFFGILLPD